MKKYILISLLFCTFSINSYSQMVGAGIGKQQKSTDTQHYPKHKIGIDFIYSEYEVYSQMEGNKVVYEPGIIHAFSLTYYYSFYKGWYGIIGAGRLDDENV